MAIYLTPPTIAWRTAIEQFREEFCDQLEPIHGSSKLESYHNIDEWITQCAQDRHEHSVQEGWVAAEQYIAIDDETDRVVGVANLRKRLTPLLLDYFGHIGYAVAPSMQQRGIGSALLRLTLLEAKKLGLTKVLVACLETNEGSIRVIENNGGQFEDKRLDPDDNGVYTYRYWFYL